jgi:diguanylate cyclase (GGDEF)-like protein/PAS domain S-box-containing protein
MKIFDKNNLKSHSDIFQSLDSDGVILAVSEPWLKKFGYTKEEVIGKTFSSFLDEECLSQVKNNFPHLKNHGFLNNAQLVVKQKNGTKSEAVLNGISEYDSNGNFENTICEIRTLADIVASEQNIKDLLEQEKLLRNLFHVKSSMLEMMHGAHNLELFLRKTILILEEPLEVGEVYFKGKEDLHFFGSKELSEEKELILENLSNNNKYISSIYIDGSDISQENYDALNTLNAYGFTCYTINWEGYELKGVIILNSISLKFEWDVVFKEIISLIHYGVKSIFNEKRKCELTKKLEELVVTDPLTNTYNRLKLKETIDNEKKLFQRDQKNFSVIMFDIDNFKNINSTHGHQIGDLILLELAQIVKYHIQASDMLFRYGGDEFMITLTHTELEHALNTAEKLRKEIAKYDFGNSIKMTVSFGVADYRNTGTISGLFNRLNTCLHQAKDAGRNCVRSLNT